MKKVLLFFIIFLTSVSLSNAQWSIDPFENNAVCTAANNQYSPQIVNDGSGGVIITWNDLRNGSGSDIYVQKINSSGLVQWTTDGVPVCTAAGDQFSPQIVSDGSGGAIITWYDYRDGGNPDIYVQKINLSGEVQWTTDGVPVCTVTGDQYLPQIVNDGLGGAIIAWNDVRIGGSGSDIYVQRINSTGVVQWTTNGVPVCTAADDQGESQIVSDGSGRAIVTWSDYRNGNYDIYAQKINSLGEVQWTNDGVPVCTAVSYQVSPQIVNDGSEGAIITWSDNRNVFDDNIYVQRINSLGEVQWTTNGVPVCIATDHQTYPQIVNDGSGGAIIAWFDDRNGSDLDIYVQKINSTSIVQWTTDGVPVCTAAGNQYVSKIVNDGLGGVIITWYDRRKVSNDDIYVQKINSSGLVQWTVNGVPVCTAAGNQSSPRIVSDGSGGAIITWHGYRNGSDADIYAQKIDALGYLGIVNPVLASVNDIRGDQGGMVSINWNASAYDMYQKKVVTYYSIWRGIETDNGATVGKEIKPGEMNPNFSGKAYRTVNSQNGTTYWEWLGNIPSHYLSNYSYTANTLSDSTSSGNLYFKFFVSAQTEDPFVFWDSNIDSGYSVDNLSPLSPQNLVATLLTDRNIELSWSKNSVDPDVKNYQVHRSENEGFTPDETTLLSSLTDTIFLDNDVPSNITSVYYKITAVDIHGNISLPSDEASIILVGVEQDKELPVEYAISQNYPNPFNPSTTISYQLADRSKVILKVYDGLGKEMETLVNEEKAAGTYEVTWNAENLPSGVYFYKLKAGSFIQTRKMILLK
jgi:predicted lipoprotein with Yx(FWY)xxD motif